MGAMKIPVGSKVGMLTVKNYRSRERKNCLVSCECGNEKWIPSDHLTRSEPVKSCGCSRWNGKHQMTDSREYGIWLSMKQRCLNPNYKQFADYGGRGIKICDEWMEFARFFSDMGAAPEGATIDRKDNLSGYSKGNCRWATRKQQQRNTRRNRLITARGETLCVSEWSERSGVQAETIRYRLQNGRSPEEAIFDKSNPNRKKRPRHKGIIHL